MIELSDIKNNQMQISREILESLSNWFIPMVVERVVEEAEGLQMIGASIDGRVIGFATLKQQTAETIEIRALGVLPDYHREGVGRRLIEWAEQVALQSGARMLSVKTVGPSDSNPNFIPTRAFYAAMGFIQVEELPLWGPETSCLLSVKLLSAA